MSKIIKLLNMNCPSLVVTKSAIAVLINPLSAIDFTVLRKNKLKYWILNKGLALNYNI